MMGTITFLIATYANRKGRATAQWADAFRMVRPASAYRSRTFALVFALFALLGLNACASQPDVESESGFKVTDLGASGLPLGWLDNETILVIFDTGERVAAKHGGLSIVHRLATINYRTKERKVYGRADAGLCFVDGYVSYAYKDFETDEVFVGYGPLGGETVQKAKPGSMQFDRGARGSCRPLSTRPGTPDWIKGKTVVWHLWPRLGLINCNVPDVSVHSQYIKARYHRAGDTSGIELPFSCYEVLDGLHYYPFKNAYFALEYDFRSPWPEGKERRIFWLFADGRVETKILPVSHAIRGNGVPTTRGVVSFARPASNEDDYWVYLVTLDTSTRILRGSGHGVTSPDGCRVAMVNDPDFKARVRNSRKNLKPATTKILDVCEGG